MDTQGSGASEDAVLGDVGVRFVKQPGHPGWDQLSMAQVLLARFVDLTRGSRVLIAPCGHGALGVWAASRVCPGNCYLYDTNLVAVDTSRATLVANDVSGTPVVVGLPDADKFRVDAALVALPKGRDLARMLLAECFACLVPGGRLYLAGANKAGIKSAVNDCADLFGEGYVLGYQKGHRVVVYTRPEAWPQPLPEAYAKPGVRRGTWHSLHIVAGERDYDLVTKPGVFSWRSLDAGTELLLSHLTVRGNDRILDVGCGYGILGMHAATQAPKGEAVLVDVDSLACDCTRENLARNGITNARVVLGDGVTGSGCQDRTLVISNPPFHSGYAVDLGATARFIRESRAALVRGGRLILVANQFLPYDRAMREVFGQVEILARTRSYRVLSATKS